MANHPGFAYLPPGGKGSTIRVCTLIGIALIEQSHSRQGRLERINVLYGFHCVRRTFFPMSYHRGRPKILETTLHMGSVTAIFH